MPAPTHITTQAYAAALAAMINGDFPVGERRKRDITSFSQLHDHIDANQYFIDLDHLLGVDAAIWDEGYNAFIAEASEAAFVILNTLLLRFVADSR